MLKSKNPEILSLETDLRETEFKLERMERKLDSLEMENLQLRKMLLSAIDRIDKLEREKLRPR